MRLLNCVCSLVVMTIATSGALSQVTRTVRPQGPGAVFPWTLATSDLSAALASAAPGDQVWVAEGVYVPTTTSNRLARFTVPSGVRVYGGFAGNETSLSQRSADPHAHETVLSGNLGAVRSVEVVRITNGQAGTLLDRVTIRDGDGTVQGIGGVGGNGASGLRIVGGFVEIRDCVISNNRGANQLLDGFPPYPGGGVGVESATTQFTRCSFTGNETLSGQATICSAGTPRPAPNGGSGGGVYAASSTVTFAECTFSNNSCGAGGDAPSCFVGAFPGANGGSGGGYFGQSSTTFVRGCAFEHNSTGRGGASVIYSGQSAVANGQGGFGGALCISGGSVQVDSCKFLDNSCGSGGQQLPTAAGSAGGPGGNGGAVSGVNGGFVVVVNSLFASNRTGDGGDGRTTRQGCGSNGGMAGRGAAIFVDATSALQVVATTLSNNASGQPGLPAAPSSNCSGDPLCCSIGALGAVGTGGIEIAGAGFIGFSSNIVWGNSSPQLAGISSGTYSCVEGGLLGEGNIASDPLFVSPGTRNFTLNRNSPCVDAGDNITTIQLSPGVQLDIYGRSRFVDIQEVANTGLGTSPIADMGASERPVCSADFNGVDLVTVQDIFDYLAAWFAGSARADFNGSGNVSVQDLFDFLSEWFQGC